MTTQKPLRQLAKDIRVGDLIRLVFEGLEDKETEGISGYVRSKYYEKVALAGNTLTCVELSSRYPNGEKIGFLHVLDKGYRERGGAIYSISCYEVLKKTKRKSSLGDKQNKREVKKWKINKR